MLTWRRIVLTQQNSTFRICEISLFSGLDRDSGEDFGPKPKSKPNRMSVVEEETTGLRPGENEPLGAQNGAFQALPVSNDIEVETLGSFYFRPRCLYGFIA